MKLHIGVIGLAAAVVSIIPAKSQAQTRPGPSAPVQVTNTAADPVPVTLQGNASVAVQGTIATTAADTTVTLIAQFVTVTDTFDGNHVIGPFDVKGYKSVRVVANRGSCTGCSDPVRVRVFSRGTAGGTTISNQLDTFLLDTPNGGIGSAGSREYEVAGEALSLSFSNPTAGSQNTVAVLVFGRRN